MKGSRKAYFDHQRGERVVVEEQVVPLSEGVFAPIHQQLLGDFEAGLVQQLRGRRFCGVTVSCAKEGSSVFTVSAEKVCGV